MHNLRLDRAYTARVLNVEGLADADTQKQLKEIRDAELPALTSAVAMLRTVDIPDRSAVVARLDKAAQSYLPLVQESAADMLKPKAERRAGLAKEIETAASEVIDDPRSSSAIRLRRRRDMAIRSSTRCW